MYFEIKREDLLKPLQMVVGVAERRQIKPILANLLLEVGEEYITMTATDMEIELIAKLKFASSPQGRGAITVLAKKFYDICRALPAETSLVIYLEGEKLLIKAGRSRFSLATLAATDFPKTQTMPGSIEFSLSAKSLYELIHYPQFSMAEQDARYYLNGILFKLHNNAITTVAADGHRLTKYTLTGTAASHQHQVIIPRKTALELNRLLNGLGEDMLTVVLSQHHLQVAGIEFVFTSRLVDGIFPDYERAIPKTHDYEVMIDRDYFKNALQRVAIVCHDKAIAVRLQFRENALVISTHNPEYEEAIEEIDLDYQGEELDISFNITYLISMLSHIPAGNVKLLFTNAHNSMIMAPQTLPDFVYVVMPLQL